MGGRSRRGAGPGAEDQGRNGSKGDTARAAGSPRPRCPPCAAAMRTTSAAKGAPCEGGARLSAEREGPASVRRTRTGGQRAAGAGARRRGWGAPMERLAAPAAPRRATNGSNGGAHAARTAARPARRARRPRPGSALRHEPASGRAAPPWNRPASEPARTAGRASLGSAHQGHSPRAAAGRRLARAAGRGARTRVLEAAEEPGQQAGALPAANGSSAALLSPLPVAPRRRRRPAHRLRPPARA